MHAVLWAMWFDDTDKKKNIELLSPGMRLRLTFALIVLRKDNCLVFDEKQPVGKQIIMMPTEYFINFSRERKLKDINNVENSKF